MTSSDLLGSPKVAASFNELKFDGSPELFVGTWSLKKEFLGRSDELLKLLGVKKFKRIYIKRHATKVTISMMDGKMKMDAICGESREYTKTNTFSLPRDRYEDNDKVTGIHSLVDVELLTPKSTDTENGGRVTGLVSRFRGKYGVLYLIQGLQKSYNADNANNANNAATLMANFLLFDHEEEQLLLSCNEEYELTR